MSSGSEQEAPVAHWREPWSVMLRVLPFPAALVDDAGIVIEANRWIDARAGQPLLQPSSDEVAPGLRFGIDSTSRWRVRSLDPAATVHLATGEREDAGDHLLRRFFSSGELLFVVYDPRGRVIESNAAWENLLGYTTDEMFGLDSWSLLPPGSSGVRERVERELREHGRSEPTFKMQTAAGEYRDITWALHFDTAVARCFGIGRDVTEEGRLTAELHRRAFTDELTGLANRARFVDELERCLAGPTTPAVLFCDLDRFKVVNDSLGHQAGDELLAQLGLRWEELAAGSDMLIARLGGDEFVGLLRNADRASAIEAARSVLGAMAEPFEVAGSSIHVTMSVGIAIADRSSSIDAERLLGQADTAAYKAKQDDAHDYKVFDDALRLAVDRRFHLEEALRRALDQGRITAYYQPIVALPGGGVIGVEALVRWPREDGHLHTPGLFLDVAEDAGLMPALGQAVTAATLDLGARLASGGRPLLVSINVSAAELADRDYVPRFLAQVEASGLDPSLVLLEITESMVINTDSAVPMLESLRAAGIKIGLDDFGTGYSSLAHLRRLPIDVVKVDRSFVLDAIDDPVTRRVTTSLIELCQALGLDVVVEGVETTDQASVVERMGATMAQGYLFHRPMSAEQLLRLLGRDRDAERRGRSRYELGSGTKGS